MKESTCSACEMNLKPDDAKICDQCKRTLCEQCIGEFDHSCERDEDETAALKNHDTLRRRRE